MCTLALRNKLVRKMITNAAFTRKAEYSIPTYSRVGYPGGGGYGGQTIERGNRIPPASVAGHQRRSHHANRRPNDPIARQHPTGAEEVGGFQTARVNPRVYLPTGRSAIE